MDGEQFDGLLRTLRDRTTRRRVLAALAGLGGLHGSETVAKRPRRSRKRRTRAQRHLSAAAKPDRQVEDQEFAIENMTCGFEVLIQGEAREQTLDFGDRLLFTYAGASVTLTLTSDESGALLQLAIPGPESVVFNEDGTVTVSGSGPWLWLSSHPVTSVSGLWLTTGRFVWIFDAEGDLVSAEFVGTSQNLCDVLT